MIYHGAICKNRGIEQLIAAIKELQNVKLLLLGNPESTAYLNFLKTQYIDQLVNKVYLMPAVPHKELWKYIGAVDICAVPIIPKCRSYYFALPNKLFEAIQAEVPLLVSDLPEMRRIVEGYQIGQCVHSEDTKELKDAILDMKQKGKETYRTKLIDAKEELTWENEKAVLTQAYSKIGVK